MAARKDYSPLYRDFTSTELEELKLHYKKDDTVLALIGFILDKDNVTVCDHDEEE